MEIHRKVKPQLMEAFYTAMKSLPEGLEPGSGGRHPGAESVLWVGGIKGKSNGYSETFAHLLVTNDGLKLEIYEGPLGHPFWRTWTQEESRLRPWLEKIELETKVPVVVELL